MVDFEDNFSKWSWSMHEPKDNETVCRVLEEIKQLSNKGWAFNEGDFLVLGKETRPDMTKGVQYRFQYYDGDGYQAILEIIKDGEHIVNSTINTNSSESFNEWFRKEMRRYDGKGNEPNPEYRGEKKAKEMNALIKQINEHFQKIVPSVSRYHRDRF
jgi:hypothetical protein